EVGKRMLLARLAFGCATGQGRYSGESVRMGQRFGNLTVTHVDLRKTVDPTFPYAGSVSFRGELTLRGEYRAHFDYPEVREPCFWVDAADGEKLPRIDFDTRKPWFCFSNSTDAIRR